MRTGWVLLLAVLLAACSLTRQSEGTDVHGEGDGPLSAQSGKGSLIGMTRAGTPQWSMTFGVFILCSTDPGAEIRVDRVRYDVSPEPLELYPVFRQVPAETDVPKGFRGIETPIANMRGKPPFKGRNTLTGSLSSTLEEPITQSCKDASPPNAMTELLTVMTVDKRGAMIRHTYIDYHVGEDHYTLEIDWRNGMCGTALARSNRCRL